MATHETPERPAAFNFANDVVDRWADKDAKMQAMLWVSQDESDKRALTYDHFSRQSHRIALVLQREFGLAKGQKLLLICARIPAWWEVATAAIRSGIILCPATTMLTPKDIEFRCHKSGASVFVGDGPSVEKFLKVRSQCSQVKTVIQLGQGKVGEGVHGLDEALKKTGPDDRFPRLDNKSEEPALIYFTSGTSGPPKMVLHSHISYPHAHIMTGRHWLRLAPGKVYWNLSEQGWAKAAWSFFGTWICGASIFIHDDRRPFNPHALLGILHKYPITTLCAPPTAYRQLVLQESQQVFKANPPQALQHCTGAGEPLNPEVIRQWKNMSGLEIHDGYGQTETILICANFAGTPIRPGSMGKPTPGVPLAVIDPNGKETSTGQEGDIAVLVDDSSTSRDAFYGLFDGYIDDSGRAVRRVKTFESADKSGAKTWYLTGDRATRDADGYIWFVGRSDDVINSAGYRIGPFEVESTLKQHPAVVESAVVSSPDEARGECVKAFVVLTGQYRGSDPDKLVSEIQNFCKEQAAPYKYPRKIQFVDSEFLPKTISGKIKRNELKKMEWAKEKDKAKL